MVGTQEMPVMRAWRWWLDHNPMYLLSAACMAEGARLLLIHPNARAGQIGLILLTLGVLQAYEWAVASILLILHRAGRSPEDGPSLMLVAALFWTGPLAATAEMTAHRCDLGLVTAVAAGLIALVELAVVHRGLGLSLGKASRLAAGGCVLLLVAAPPLIRVPEVIDGLNELYLYLAWWILAALALSGVVVARRGRAGRPAVRLGIEFGLLGVVVAVTAAHLVAMNYAYFCHARLFYVSPLLMALAMVGVESAVAGLCRQAASAAATVLPVAAIIFALQPFAEEVPISVLPVVLREPVGVILALAALAWWYGGARLHQPILIHAGSAAMAGVIGAALYKCGWALSLAHAILPSEQANRVFPMLILYAAVIYLVVSALIRKSRLEGAAALIIHQLAVTGWVWDRVADDVLIVALSGGWVWLIAVHLLSERPRWTETLWPVLLLMLAGWSQEFNEVVPWAIRLHGGLVVAVLLVAHFIWPKAGYRNLAAGAGLAHGLVLGGRGLATGPHAMEILVVLCGFVLLAGGAVISWYKQSLLGAMAKTKAEPVSEPAPPEESEE